MQNTSNHINNNTSTTISNIQLPSSKPAPLKQNQPEEEQSKKLWFIIRLVNNVTVSLDKIL